MKKQWCTPEPLNAEFVWKMEDVLDLYEESYDTKRPVVCFDEMPYQMVAQKRIPEPALDNAMAESFVSTLKTELVSEMKFPSQQSAKTAIFEYLETFYNIRRFYSSLGHRSLADFERGRIEEARVA